MEKIKKENKGYSSRFGMLCVMLAASVGTGNLWRYPRLVCEYGGGFVFVTVLALILIAIPIVMVETFAGRASRHSAPGAFRDTIGPKFTWMGTFGTVVYFMVHSCYIVVLAWCVRYTFMSMGKTYFGVKDKLTLFNDVASGDWITALCWIGVLILAYLCVTRQSLLEKVTKLMVPALFVIVVILVFYAVTRGGASAGLKYAFNFGIEDITNSTIWIEGMTQVFWSLGPGMMVAISIAKFAPKNEDIVVNTRAQGFGDMTFALLGTLIVLPCIFAFTGSQEEAVELCRTGNNGLTFVGLTSLFEDIPGGALIGTFFFLALAFAAFSSVIVATTCYSGIFTDCGMSRKKASAIVIGGHCLFGLPSILSQDILSNQDTVWGFGVFIGAMMSLFLGIRFGAKKIREKFINPVSDKKMGKSFDILVNVVAPVATVAVFVKWIIDSIGWDEQWWNPISVSSLGTMVVQWTLALVISLGVNKMVNKKTRGSYVLEEGFDDVPAELMKDV